MTGLDLKLLRVRAGLTQRALGKLCKVDAARICEMEKDQRQVSQVVVDAANRAIAARHGSDGLGVP